MFDAASAQQGQMQEFTAKSGAIAAEMLAPLEHPWKIAVLPGDRLLITEKPGRLRTLRRDIARSETRISQLRHKVA